MNGKKNLVIIGGGFGGLELLKRTKGIFNTLLIDSKEYFEYTPTVINSFTDTKFAKKMSFEFKKFYKDYFLRAYFEELIGEKEIKISLSFSKEIHQTKEKLISLTSIFLRKKKISFEFVNENPEKIEFKLKFDFLALSHGAKYSPPIHHSGQISREEREKSIQDDYKLLKKSKKREKILIVGGGFVSVELAARLKYKTSHHITLITRYYFPLKKDRKIFAKL